MKATGIILLVVGIVFAISRGIFRIYVHYEYKNEIGCNWDLSDRASTIAQKSEYLDKFVLALEKCKLDGTHDALFFPNDENDFTQNMKALKSLQKRLRDISTMDENSFAYQTAMQQITAQEQGEAHNLLDTLYGCWQKEYHYSVWNNLMVIGFLILQALMIIAGIILINED